MRKVRATAHWLDDWGVPDMVMGIALGFAIGVAVSVSSWSPVVFEGMVKDNTFIGSFDIQGDNEDLDAGWFVLHAYVIQWVWYQGGYNPAWGTVVDASENMTGGEELW